MIYNSNNDMLQIYSRTKKFIAPDSLTWPLGYFEIKKSKMLEWINDILEIKKMITNLPATMNIIDYKSYYHLSSELYEAFQSINQSLDNCFRPDCILTDEGLKIIELNIDPGAMMVQTGVAPRDILLSCLKIEKKTTEEMDQVRNSYFADLAWVEYLKRKAPDSEILLWDIPRTAEQAKIRLQLEQVLIKVGTAVRFISGNEIFDYKDRQKIKIFRIFSYPHLQALSEVRSSFINIKNSSGHYLGAKNMIFDSKINFALLWDTKIFETLTASQQSLVKKYIPETYFLSQQTISNICKSSHFNKNYWILKAINSFQGKDVHIGKEISPSDWPILLEKLLLTENFILQKRQQPKQFDINWLGLSNHSETNTHLLNLFYIDDEFAGSVCRVTRGASLKIGAVDNNQVYALPIWIK